MKQDNIAMLQETLQILDRGSYEVNGKTEFFRGCPAEWRDVSFENIALSDGRRVCGRRLDGKVTVTASP